MKFSIVTVSFNQAAFLEQTLLSVLDQDYPDVEYIVVDPGSTDGSREIIERYRDRISKIVYQTDQGAAEGLNNGFALATGDIYGFLNSDDLLLPGALSTVADAFRSAAEPDLVTAHCHIIDAEGRWLRHSYTDRFDLRAFAYECCIICQLSTFFKADLFRKAGGFNVKNSSAWDAELFLSVFQDSRRTVMLDTFLGAFRIHSAAITGGATRHQQLREFETAKFHRIMGRPRRRSDQWIRLFYLLRKYLREPRAVWQRLRYGSVYGRYSGARSRR